jgi:two-component system, NtrC family, response regulator HydG
MDSVADGVFTVDRDMHVIAFNRAAELLTGIKRADAVGRPCHEIFRTSVCDNLLSGTGSNEERVNRLPTAKSPLRTNEDKLIPVSVSASILYDDEGNPIGGVETHAQHEAYLRDHGQCCRWPLYG